MRKSNRCDLVNDLVLPTVLFAALGGMNWAVRGTRGFGGMAGCIFAGVTWGAAWWYIARDATREQSRRYASGWVVPAITFGIAISGARGWRQWSHFFTGQLFTNFAKQEFVPISNRYGFLWLFIAGVPWAGLGACLLAWCGPLRETRIWHWVFRIGCGLGAGALARVLFDHYPEYFLPLYSSMEARYQDFDANPDLKRMINDCGAALMHLGWYLGFLLFEVARRDWKNVVLISTVGLVNGAGWAALQNWEWAPSVWKNTDFAWWRCWESSGGISIGIAFGIAYFLVNRSMSDKERTIVASRHAMAGPNGEWLLIFSGMTTLLFVFMGELMGRRGSVGMGELNLPQQVGPFLRDSLDAWSSLYFGAVLLFAVAYYVLYRGTNSGDEPRAGTPSDGDPNLERLAVYLGLLAGLAMSLLYGSYSWFETYRGNEGNVGLRLWHVLGPAYFVVLLAILGWTLLRPLPRDFRGNLHPHAYGLMWLVLIVQNAIAQLVTGPPTLWNEFAFNLYYGLLFLITAVIVLHVHAMKAPSCADLS